PRTRAGRPRTLAQTPSDVLLILLQVGFTEPLRSPGTLVVSYTTVSPLPAPGGVGGLFSVALSRGSPRVGVTHHLALWSPDLPRHQVALPPRPPGQLIRGPSLTRTAPSASRCRLRRASPSRRCRAAAGNRQPTGPAPRSPGR